jgi:YVTN family beta-propeller protein
MGSTDAGRLGDVRGGLRRNDGAIGNPDATRTRSIYVTNQSDGTVSVIDTATNTVTATIAVGNQPNAVAVNATTGRFYVTNQADGTVSVIDAATNTIVATISTGSEPFGVAVNATTGFVYVTHTGTPSDPAGSPSGTVSVIDAATNTVTGTVTVGESAAGIAVNPATGDIYIADYVGSNVLVLEPIAGVAPIAVGVDGPAVCLAFNPVSGYIYAPSGYSVSVVDAGARHFNNAVTVGGVAYGVAVNPATGYLYVTDPANGTVLVLPPIAGQPGPVTTVPVGGTPLALAVY